MSNETRAEPPREAVARLLAATPETSGARGFEMSFIMGHASNRQYYRLHLEGGGGPASVVLMQLAEESFKSEEISAEHERPGELPFVDVGRLLERAGLPVPRVLRHDEDAGLLLLTDLGDTAVEELVVGAPEHERRALYEQAIDLLVQVQAAGEHRDPSESIALRRRFDPLLLRWELDHFREYGLEVGAGAPLSPAARKELDAAFDDIVARLSEVPVCLTHRDFQSRNLMLHEGRLWLIDFQDALVGPVVYDLVALLRDSYVELSADEVTHLVGCFLARRPQAGLPTIDEGALWEAFRLQTLQRKLKDAGRFVFIDRVKGNPSFLRHIPASYRYVRDALDQLPEYSVVTELLETHQPERAAGDAAAEQEG